MKKVNPSSCSTKGSSCPKKRILKKLKPKVNPSSCSPKKVLPKKLKRIPKKPKTSSCSTKGSSCPKKRILPRIPKIKDFTSTNVVSPNNIPPRCHNVVPIKKYDPHPDPQNKFNYSDDTKEVLSHWMKMGGKVPIRKSKNNRTSTLIDNMIFELLLEGRNPYINVISDDSPLKTKKWTTKEIKQTITYSKETLHKDLSKFTFDKYIVFDYYASNLPASSPLINSFSTINFNYMSTRESLFLKKCLSASFNGTSIPEVVFIKASKYIKELNKKYIVGDAACTSFNGNVFNVFVSYVHEKMNDFTWKPAYIAGDTFKNEFIEVMLKRNNLELRKGLYRVDRTHP